MYKQLSDALLKIMQGHELLSQAKEVLGGAGKYQQYPSLADSVWSSIREVKKAMRAVAREISQ